MKKNSCENRIDDALASHLEDFTQPDFDSMSLEQIKAFVKETSEDYPLPTPEDIRYIDGVAYEDLGDAWDYNADDILDEDNELNRWQELAETVWEEKREWRGEMVISVTEKRVVEILLSTGGPEDLFEIDIEDNEIVGGRYRFKDWFDGAVREISAEQAELVVDGTDTYIEGVH